MVRSAVALLAVLSVVVAAGGVARAQTSLGGQRVATASGTFLKIGLDARVAGLGGAATAVVSGPFAALVNPAALARMEGPGAGFAYARWPADIDLLSFAIARPLGEAGATAALSLVYLGTTLDETTEFHPQGTGRSFGYSDFLFGFSLARPFSDRLSIGATVKYLREDLGSSIGGPTTQGWLFDAGSMYLIGALNGRLAIGLLHFGPDLRPDGSFRSHIQQADVEYSGFSPPTSFRLGFSLEPYRHGPHSLTTTAEVAHVSDNQETFRTGLEYDYQKRYFARSGFDAGADTGRFSAGAGVQLPWSGSRLKVDYAYTDGGPLLAIHRWSVVLPL